MTPVGQPVSRKTSDFSLQVTVALILIVLSRFNFLLLEDFCQNLDIGLTPPPLHSWLSKDRASGDNSEESPLPPHSEHLGDTEVLKELSEEIEIHLKYWDIEGCDSQRLSPSYVYEEDLSEYKRTLRGLSPPNKSGTPVEMHPQAS
jgi:hypothetical protein